MEFYFNPIIFYTIFKRFQFPTGWNSTRRSSEGLGWKEVSIPNGMEFYGIFNEPKIWPVEMFQFPTGWNSTRFFFIGTEHFLAFQFPTGWNSTDRSKTFHSQILVSIPNGMEFYLYLPVQLVTSIKVSIPNGMEFYSIGYYIARGVTSFNSQRDGILLVAILSGGAVLRFQFPTGWNSTKLTQSKFFKNPSVSIPNGMEFYLHQRL